MIFVKTGMQNLECLTELDLSYNCLMEHSVLWPLEKMSALLWVSLEGNPLSYHPKHRLLSVKHLHPALSDSKVDRKTLDTMCCIIIKRQFCNTCTIWM